MVLTILLLTALINIALGVISYNKNPRSATHRLLTLLTVIFAAWIIANYFSLNSEDAESTLFWIRAVMFITAPLGPVLYFFIKSFPTPDLNVKKKVFKVLVVLTLIVQALAFTPYIFSSVRITDQITPQPEFGIVLFAVLFVVVPLAGFIELIRKYRKSRGIEKLQIKYLFVGITVTFILLILTNFISVVVFNFSGFVMFGPMFSLILVGFILYAIIRHRLLEVRVIIARSVVYTILILLVGASYTSGIFLISQHIFGNEPNLVRGITYAGLALFTAFTFVPLRNYIEKVTDKIFFKGKYDPSTLAFQLTKIIASTITLEDLTGKTLQKLVTSLRVKHGAFIVYGGRQLSIYSHGYTINDDQKKALGSLYALSKIVIFDEEKNNKIKDIMRVLDAAVVVPLFERGKKVGVLLLGEKKSGQIFSPQAISVLEILGPVVAVAIRNAKSYEAIKKFNITLKKEVRAATKDLKAANAQLKKLGKQKDEFIAIASHELKTPITSVKLYTQVLLQNFQKQKDLKSAAAVGKMDAQLRKLSLLINDLLDMTKIEEGKLQFKPQKLNMNKLVNETVENMQGFSSHKILTELENVGEVNADYERIGQVITNFITNAIKYSPKAKKVIVRTQKDDRRVTVSVQDFGMGLAPAEQKKVFERFNRASQEAPGGLPGLGLGLYIAKVIVKAHKGEIWVESRRKKGSTFYFSLPIK
jgi:signal transduction histidine kinase